MNLENKVKNRYWISKYLLELLFRVSKLERSSGGGSQDLQSVMENGKVYFNPTTYEYLAFNFPFPNSVLIGTKYGGMSSRQGSTTLSNNFSEIANSGITSLTVEAVADKNLLFSLPTDKSTGDYIIATLEDIEALKNEQGQVKVNYTGLSTVGFVAETLKTLDINGATPTIVSSPTTKFPFSTPNTYAGFFDSARGSSPTGRLIENPIDGQVHTWRFQISYINKGAGNNGSLDLILTNPVSGFQYVMPFTLPSGRTEGTLNNVAITIADGASIPAPNGYILQCRTSFSDANLTIDSISITRISQAVENF